MAEKIFEVEYSPEEGLVLRFHRPKSQVLGSAQRQLRRPAREMLLSLRSLLDAALKQVEEKEAGGKRSTKIEVK